MTNLFALTANEIVFTLELISLKYGTGYSDQKKVGAFQAKLSLMLEMTHNAGNIGEDMPNPREPITKPEEQLGTTDGV